MTTSMSAILADITSIVTSATSWMTQVVDFITSNPVILLGVLVPFVGLGIGLVRRLLGL